MKKEGFSKAKKFVEKNKKPLLIIGGTLATGALAILGYNVLGEGDPEPYTTRWLKGLSDDELPEEHEKARLLERAARDDWDLACKMDFWRRKIDAEIELRKHDDVESYTPLPHREHGRNLYKPE